MYALSTPWFWEVDWSYGWKHTVAWLVVSVVLGAAGGWFIAWMGDQ